MSIGNFGMELSQPRNPFCDLYGVKVYLDPAMDKAGVWEILSNEGDCTALKTLRDQLRSMGLTLEGINLKEGL